MTNIQSLKSKIDEVRLVFAAHTPDIACVTETWLSQEIESELMNVDGYSLVRTDRRRRRGGGTAMYIRRHINYVEIDISEHLGSEIEATFVDFPQLQLCMMCIYFPPQLSARTLYQARDSVDTIIDAHLTDHVNRQVMIMGDFNSFDVKALCSDLNLVDVVDKPTRQAKILDHILISDDLTNIYQSSSLSVESPVGKSDHATLILKPSSQEIKHHISRYHTVFDFRESNIAKLLARAEHIDWHNITKPEEDINTQWTKLHQTIQGILKECIPQRTVRMTDHEKPWMTPITKLLLNQKWVAYRRKNWQKFAQLKVKCQAEIRKAKEIWAKKLKQQPDGLWRLTKELTGKAGGSELESLITQYDSPQALAETIAQNVTSSHTIIDSSIFPTNISDAKWMPYITTSAIEKELRSLKVSKSAGADGIPNKVYRCLASCLAPSLKIIFDTSISSKCFPKEWKKGIIVPIPKSRPPLINKLRTISLLPAPAKILEKLILRGQSSFIEPLVGNQQHAFRKFASTTTALISVTDSITKCYDDPSMPGVGLLSLDFSRAFDMVDHEILLRKICSVPELAGFAKWLNGYLTERYFTVRVSGQHSNLYPIGTGVPQGSVLGPSLFSILVGDLAECCTGNDIIQYADDVNIVIPLREKTAEATTNAVKRQLSLVQTWCAANNQVLNVGKSKLLLTQGSPFQNDDQIPVRRSTTIKILGVHLRDDLKWDEHITNITKRASQRLHILRTLKPHTSSSELHQVYVASILSLFDYCSPVFPYLTNKLRQLIRKVERRAHRIIFGENYQCSCHIDGSLTRHQDHCLRLFEEALKKPEHLLHPKMPQRLTHSNRLTNYLCRTTKRQHSFFPYTTLLYNSKFNSSHVTTSHSVL